MILRITEDVTRVAVRLRNAGSCLADWRRILLTIHPGQWDNPRGPNGSPWILHGCWYGLPTEVDTANPPPCDFPAITIRATGITDDCELEFALPKRFKELPVGRYTGIVHHDPILPVDPCGEDEPPPKPKPRLEKWPLELLGVTIPPCTCCQAGPPPPPRPPRMEILAMFDIDYGLRLDAHMIDHASITVGRDWCDEDGC